MANQFDSVWPEERIERLRELWDEGHSSAEIGRLMGTTKNAIVGKAHRLDLPSRPSPIHTLAPGQSYKKQKPRPRVLKTLPDLPSIVAMRKTTPPVRVLVKIVAPKSIVVAKPKPALVVSLRPCAFPMWNGPKPTHRYCEKPSHIRSYCLEHAKVCYAHLPREAA